MLIMLAVGSHQCKNTTTATCKPVSQFLILCHICITANTVRAGIRTEFSIVTILRLTWTLKLLSKFVLKYTHNPKLMCRKYTRVYYTEVSGFQLKPWYYFHLYLVVVATGELPIQHSTGNGITSARREPPSQTPSPSTPLLLPKQKCNSPTT